MSDQTERFADDAQRYRLESRIATGGMGEVWRARDTVLDRAVAVKLLKAEYADDPQFRSRFETEARHAGSLHHPGIASVFDFGQASSSGAPLPYLVMELVEGQPLSALLRPDSPMDPAVASDLLAQAGDALGAAHRSGIVHRDVKPANLLVMPDRRVKITDFGIARAADGVALTQTGQVMGTPQYLSPEQARGERSGPASDVYALGVVAFECLVGRRPFVADSPVATALAHVREPVPELPDSVPPDLAAVVRRSLAKDPEERYADGSAFASALRDPAAAAAALGGAGAATVAMPPPVADGTRVMPAPAPVPASGPATSATTTAPTAGSGKTKKRGLGWLPWALLVLALVVAIFVLVQLASDDDADTQQTQEPRRSRTPSPSETSSTPTQTPTETPSETPSETETSEDTSVTVDPDDYVGRPRDDVEGDLGDLGLSVSTEEVDNDGTQEEGIVESVEPSGTLQEGDPITVFYYGPPPPDEVIPSEGNGSEGNGNSGNGNSGEGNSGEGNQGNGNGKDDD